MGTASDTVRIAMIGCGRRAPAWVRTIRAVPQARLVALCDRVGPRVGVLKGTAGDPAIREYTDHRRMLDEGGFDAVAVVTEPEYQALLSIDALEAGYHVISEVPVCYSLDECARLVKTVERTRRIYYLAEQIRHSPLIRWWQTCVRRGDIGSVLFAEGHYLHAMSVERFWRNGKTGELLTWEQAAANPDAVKTRMWTIPHPILYGPHEMSPLLKVLDDRVVRVSCLSTGSPSRRFREVPWPGQTEEYPIADLEVAMMHTAKGAILRFAAGFQAPVSENHWYHLLGTKGELETGRGQGEPGHSYRMAEPVTHKSLHNSPRTPEPWYSGHVPPPPEVEHYLKETLSEAARATGHGGYDYYPLANFVGAVLGREKPDIDVYQAVETAAPVIVAAQSAERGGEMMAVPDFRPAPG